MSRAMMVATAAMFVLNTAFIRGSDCVGAKPVKISGALCGTVFDAIGRPAPNVTLRVVDSKRNVVAETKADSDAHFQFPPLPRGRLVVSPLDWTMLSGQIEITTRSATSCTRPVSVYLGVGDCSGSVSSKKPRNTSKAPKG